MESLEFKVESSGKLRVNSAFSAISARVFPSFSLHIRVFRVFRCSIIERLLVIGYWLLSLMFIGYGLLVIES